MGKTPLTRGSRIALVTGLLVWLLGVGAGFERVLAHASTPGIDGTVPAHWPIGTALGSSGGPARLVMFVHPRCPCSRASLRELARLVPRLGGQVSTMVVMNVPRSSSPDWEEGEIWRLARSIPNVTVVADGGGIETRRFGTATSGHVALYSRAGRLLFSGGITAARGHEGSSPGQDAILSSVSNEGRRLTASVFGCELFNDK